MLNFHQENFSKSNIHQMDLENLSKPLMTDNKKMLIICLRLKLIHRS